MLPAMRHPVSPIIADLGLGSVAGHLAIEEAALEAVTPERPVVLFYRSHPAVVMGKNQVPWREANLRVLREHGIPLVRRYSGGGTVVQDPGNLSVAFLTDRRAGLGDRQFGILIRALARLGVRAEEDARHSLRVGVRKVSGNAFCLRRQAAAHHATLLVEADLDRMRAALKLPESLEVAGGGIASTPAPVVNLRDLDARLDLGAVQAAVIQEVEATWGAADVVRAPGADPERVAALRQAHEDRAWVLGRGPPCRIRWTGDGPPMNIEVRGGAVASGTCGGRPLAGWDLHPATMPEYAPGLAAVAWG